MSGLEFLRELKRFNAEQRNAEMFTSATASPLLPRRPAARAWMAPARSVEGDWEPVALLDERDPLVPIDTASAKTPGNRREEIKQRSR